jgi:hypothetical protein
VLSIPRLAIAAAALAAVALSVGCAGGGNGASTRAARSTRPAYDVDTSPADFTSKVDNPWFPLKPGNTYVYSGTRDGQPVRDVFRVTGATKVIGGVRCVVIDDRVYTRGRLTERTRDYFTQDRRGNVWYFGEDTAELRKDGTVSSTEGTWHTGVDGAQPGVFMPARPRVGERHRQEYYKGHAEDWFRVASLNGRVRVPYGSFAQALETREWTPLEPGVLDSKVYVRGIGQVSERSIRGGREYLSLASFKRG